MKRITFSFSTKQRSQINHWLEQQALVLILIAIVVPKVCKCIKAFYGNGLCVVVGELLGTEKGRNCF